MILSHRKRFVLLAPWKTASSTAHLRLQHYNESPYSRFYDYNVHLQRVVHQHITYADFAALPEGRQGYFSGAFVRNPYDRVYSGFIQIQRDLKEQPTVQFPNPWIKELVMKQLWENLTQLKAADFDFDKWFALIREYQVYEVGRNTSLPLHPAHYWTGINLKQDVDFIGKVENFEADYAAFCKNIGVTSESRENTNVSGPISQTDYRYLERMNPASIWKVNTLFEQDFQLFDYKVVVP